MECPKCHKIISDKETTCPHCHKVITLVCPNCHTESQTSVCKKCGYIILEKCAKCGKLTPTVNASCKCGLSVSSSIACNECESDEFASVTIKFGALKAIRRVLASKELYSKFLIKLKNLVSSQLKGLDGNTIIYGDDYVVNFNKELSFPTSVNKAIRFSIKVLNAFSGLNLRVQEELGIPLKLVLTIQKKYAEELLVNKSIENNIKLLNLKKDEKKYIRGMQIVLDQYVQDCISKDYKTDSLYLLENNKNSIMFYELILDSYVLPPNSGDNDKIEVSNKTELPKMESEEQKYDIYGFNIFDIKAKCNFERCYSEQVFSKLNLESKIVSICGEKELLPSSSDLIKFYKSKGLNPLYISCSEDMNYNPWGFFKKVFKDYYALSSVSGLINSDLNCGNFTPILELIFDRVIKASSPEDSRYAYMEIFTNFLTSMKNSVILIDGAENLDDTSLQTLELYFDRYKKINVNFVFLSNSDFSLHSKIKSLLRTNLYTEFTMVKNSISNLLSDLKEDAEDFIQSFYYEKIKENFDGSKLYFRHALKHLSDKDVLVSFDNKLILKNNKSVLLSKNLQSLIKSRLKGYSKYKDASMILAYSSFLGERLDFAMLETLGINNIQENAKILEEAGFTFTNGNVIYINDYSLIRPVIQSSLKPEVEEFLAKNILAKLGKFVDNTTLFSLMGVIKQYKEEYMLLWKNSQIAINSGDYDAYLKNSLGFLSIIDKIKNNIPPEDIEENKKEVYQNILLSLYSYSPEKIYSIEKILLMDALKTEDNEKIVKLSNLMLQGALVSANYAEAHTLLHNILTRIPNPTLIINNAINTKFLLLSLVNIEILFNIGDFTECIEVGRDVLNVIKPDILDKIKPNSFSANLFVNHLLETFRLVAFAMLITNDDKLDNLFEKIQNSLDAELPEKSAICAIKEFLKGTDFVPSNIEESSAVSKVIFLILQELTNLKNNYNDFAQNIYQAKLLASDLHQTQLGYICDLLIAYAYAKKGVFKKAFAIINDVLEMSKKSAIFNIYNSARYLMAKISWLNNNYEDSLLMSTEAINELNNHNNEAILFYAMFEKLYVDIQKENLSSEELKIEEQKLLAVSPNGELERIIRSVDFQSDTSSKENDDNRTEVHA